MHCIVCGGEVPQAKGPGRRKEYCAGTCKSKAWLVRHIDPKDYVRLRAHFELTTN